MQQPEIIATQNEQMAEDSGYKEYVMERTKHIALIAHDAKKRELCDWAYHNREILKQHFLCGTGTTAHLIAEKTGLPVKAYHSGPLGGDQQIGARIVEGEIDFVIFLWDPLEAQPHDPDVKALLRIAVVYNIPIANTLATADFLLASRLMDQPYVRRVEDHTRNLRQRLAQLSAKQA